MGNRDWGCLGFDVDVCLAVGRFGLLAWTLTYVNQNCGLDRLDWEGFYPDQRRGIVSQSVVPFDCKI